MMPQPPKLIALDLDGTLLTHDKQISERNKAAIDAARAAGIQVVLSSGRTHEATCRYAKRLEFDDNALIASYNGSRVGTVGGEILFERGIPVENANYLIDYAEENGYHLNFYSEDVLYVKELNEWSALYERRTGTKPNPIGSLVQLKSRIPTKLLIVDSFERTNSLLAPMKAHYGDSLYITKTDDEYIEFMNPTVNKGLALSFVAERLGIAQENVWAFGDNYNDISMLEWAGWSYAMENGKPDAKAIASEVAPAADADGVAQIIERELQRMATVK